MAEELLTRLLVKNCHSAWQLAISVATLSKELLPVGALERILDGIKEDVKMVEVSKGAQHCKEETEGDRNKRMTNAGAGDEEDVQGDAPIHPQLVEGGLELIKRFLDFTNFPGDEEMRVKLIEAFFKQAI